MCPRERGTSTGEDALLVRKVLRGDLRAFQDLITQYQRLVTSIVFRMVEQKEDREDLCQEIFVKVYEKLNTFKFHSKLSTWIAHIAFNHCINFLKKKKPKIVQDIYSDEENFDETFYRTNMPELAGTEIRPDQELDNKELSNYLANSMENLSVIQRTIVYLFHQLELPLEEIARITALPVNTVKSHLFRARAILKTELLKYLNH